MSTEPQFEASDVDQPDGRSDAAGDGGLDRARALAELQHAGLVTGDEDATTLGEIVHAYRELRHAQLVAADEPPEATEIMIEAYRRLGGLPSRIVNAGEGVHAIPDATQTRRGRRLLSGLEGKVERRTGTRPPSDEESR